MGKRLLPFAEAVRTRIARVDGMSVEEFNDELHLWILEPVTESVMETTRRRGSVRGTHYGEQWSCAQCSYVNPKGTSTRCTMCGQERAQRSSGSGKGQCGAVWHYSLIKQLLVDFDCSKLEALSARN